MCPYYRCVWPGPTEAEGRKKQPIIRDNAPLRKLNSWFLLVIMPQGRKRRHEITKLGGYQLAAPPEKHHCGWADTGADLESLVRLLRLDLLGDSHRNDGDGGQANQHKDKDNTCWKHF